MKKLDRTKPALTGSDKGLGGTRFFRRRRCRRRRRFFLVSGAFRCVAVAFPGVLPAVVFGGVRVSSAHPVVALRQVNSHRCPR